MVRKKKKIKRTIKGYGSAASVIIDGLPVKIKKIAGKEADKQ